MWFIFSRVFVFAALWETFTVTIMMPVCFIEVQYKNEKVEYCTVQAVVGQILIKMWKVASDWWRGHFRGGVSYCKTNTLIYNNVKW